MGRARTDVIQEHSSAFTVLELLISISIIGILVALLLPAIMFAREAARRTSCVNHLREIGIAIQSHHDSHHVLPTSWKIADNDPDFAYGWTTDLLPDIEATAVEKSLNRKLRPVSASVEGNSYAVSLAVLICPSDITEPTFELHKEGSPDDETGDTLLTLPTANYVGVFGTSEADEFQEPSHVGDEDFADGSIIHEHKIGFANLSRGLTNTFLVGERMMATVPSTWLGVDLRGEDAPCRLVGSAMTRPNCGECDECEFTSRHPGGANFVCADGHVVFISDSIETDVYREFARRDSQQ
jgi:prepilin-type processing-associated H-X9-DG protein